MTEIPGCTRLGSHCRALDVTLRIADLEDDSVSLQDAAATWLLGHTERITFGKPYIRATDLLVDATIHVPCKFLTYAAGPAKDRSVRAQAPGGADGGGPRPRVHCAAHGYRGVLPRDDRSEPPPLRGGGGAYRVTYKGRQRMLPLPLKRSACRQLPVLADGNPCATAPCRTADNTQGAACCRDLSLDLELDRGAVHAEALLKSRKSPYLCKVTREDDDKVEVEVISACGYLQPDGVSCALHDRLLPNGRLAKPSICREWPDIDEDEVAHPGCALV